MDAPHNTISTHRLLAALSPKAPRLPYDVLLDITGEFRKHCPFRDMDYEACFLNVTLNMRMAGRVKDAERIEVLCHILTDAGLDQSVLFSILMTARNIHMKQRLLPRSIFGSDKLVMPRDVTFQKVTTSVPHIFTEPIGADDVEANGGHNIFAPSLHVLGISKDEQRGDCIYDAAQFSRSENLVWLQHKENRGTLNTGNFPADHTREDLGADFLVFVKNQYKNEKTDNHYFQNDESTCEDYSFPQLSNQELLLRHVLCRCISGPDILELDERPSVTFSPSRLASAIADEDGDISTEMNHILYRRQEQVWQRSHMQKRFHRIDSVCDEVAELTVRASTYGSANQDLLSFAEVYTLIDRGKAVNAVANFAYDVTRNYLCSLITSAQSEDVHITNKPWAILGTAEMFFDDMCIIADILLEVENSDGCICAIINLLSDSSVCRPGNKLIQDLLSRVLTAYLENIWDWVFEGSSARDVRNEFFGTSLGLSMTASEALVPWEEKTDQCETGTAYYPKILNHENALFLLHAGRTRALLQHFGLHSGSLSLCPPEVKLENYDISFIDICRDLTSFAEKVTSGFQQRPELCNRKKSNPNPILQNEHILSESAYSWSPSGGSNQVVSSHNMPSSCFSLPEYEPDYSFQEGGKNIKLFSNVLEDGSNTSFQGAIHIISEPHLQNLLPLQIMFRDFIVEPLTKIDGAVQRKVMDCFMHDLHLCEHFKNLRCHALLGAGDFASVLVDQLEVATRTSDANERYIQRHASTSKTFYGSSGPGGRYLRDRNHLNRCLKTALNLCNSVHNPLSDLLSLEAINDAENEKGSLWDCTMDLRYNVGFPLNVILSDEAMSAYSLIFDFFVRVLRAKKSLRRLFMLSRRNSVITRSSDGSVLRNRQLTTCLYQFCWQAEHFVSIFGGFEMEQVLGSAWGEFESSWGTVKSVWELRDSHNKFLEGAIRRCLLSERHKSVLSVMSGGFDIVVQLEREMSRICQAGIPNSISGATNTVDLLVSSSVSLRRRSAFLTDVLERLVGSGNLPHLEDLLTRLNFNHFYQKVSA